MGQAPGQFPPGGNAFGLYEPLLLLEQFVRHAIERVSKLSDLIR